MQPPELDEITVRGLVAELLPQRLGRKWRHAAEVYLLLRYGDKSRGINPGLTIFSLAKRLKRPESTVRLWRNAARDVMDPEIERRTKVAIILTYKPPEEGGLNFGDTIQYGHDTDTRDDEVEKTVVLGREIERQDWTPGMGPGK